MSAAALLIAGGGLQAAGAIQEGRIAKAQGSFANKLALRNQQSLERQAKAEAEAASVEESRIARKEKIVKASQRAAFGKSGVGLAGASLEFLIDTAGQFSMERNLALRRGMIRGRELKQRGQIIAAQGKWAKRLGVQAKRLSYVKASASILGSAGMAGMLKPAAAAGTGGLPTVGTVTPSAGASYARY